MNDYLDDYEQGQAVKKWFKDNGTSLIVGVALGLGGIFGWQQFKDWRGTQQAAAASAFRQMMVTLESGDTEGAEAQAASVRNEFSSSPYAALTALEQAQLAMEKDDLEAAIGHLEFAVQNGKPAAVGDLARVRLARVLFEADRGTEALAQLDDVTSGAFVSSAEELRGDILLADNQPERARAAYERSLSASEGGAGGRALLQLKIDDLAVANPVSAPAAGDEEPS